MRFVIVKNDGLPSSTTHRASTPAPWAYDRSDASISATPPPRAVEFTFHTVRPAKKDLAARITTSKRA